MRIKKDHSATSLSALFARAKQKGKKIKKLRKQKRKKPRHRAGQGEAGIHAEINIVFAWMLVSKSLQKAGASANMFQEKTMVTAVVLNVLSECFVLKVGEQEFRVTQANEAAFEALVGCQKGEQVDVKIEGGEIVMAQR